MKILIADTDPVSGRFLERVVAGWGYDPVIACDANALRMILGEERDTKLAILDWGTSGLDGVEICRLLRDRPESSYVYILLLTRTDQEVVEGLAAGADDCLAKPFEAETLRIRLRAGQRIIQLQQHLLATDEALRSPAVYDVLTGLWNREATLELLRRSLGRGGSATAPVSIVQVSIDRFQDIRRLHGHRRADAVLREIARRLVADARFFDSVGRCGDGEFLIVMPETDTLAARASAQDILALVAKDVCDVFGAVISVTASVGVAAAGDLLAPDVHALVWAADHAVRQARRRGGNQIQVAAEQECGQYATA